MSEPARCAAQRSKGGIRQPSADEGGHERSSRPRRLATATTLRTSQTSKARQPEDQHDQQGSTASRASARYLCTGTSSARLCRSNVVCRPCLSIHFPSVWRKILRRCEKAQPTSSPSRRPKQSCHNCETKVVTPPLTTMADWPEASTDEGFQWLRSKGVTSQLVLRQRIKFVTAFLTV